MSTSSDDLAASMLAAWNAGRADRIIALAGAASVAAIDDERVLALLGLAQQHQGATTLAIETFTRLATMRPDQSAYWNNLGVACREARQVVVSERAFARARELAPRDAEVHYNLGLLYLQQRRWPAARQVLMDAVALSPGFVPARVQAAHACHVCGDSEGEAAMLEGADGWPSQPATDALKLAAMLSGYARLDAALATLARAQLPAGSDAEPWRLRITAQRVLLYERTNRLDDATRELGRLPLASLEAPGSGDNAVRVDGWRAHAVLAQRRGRHDEAVALYRRALDLAVDPEIRAAVAFALARALDAQAHYAGAWQALGTAHAAQVEIVREAAPERLAPDRAPLPMAARTVDAGMYARWHPLDAPAPEASPIFVIGFPRSGTTLLEQMLDAHPDFRSMGERGFIYDLIDRMAHAAQRYPGDLATLAQHDADRLRAIYWRRAASVLPERGTRRLVDKNPLNMLCLPMITRLFPHAPIILCLRHPCDVLLSCSMQSFRSPAFMAMCASLPRLARGYADAFAQCCAHVRVFGLQVLAWRYESAVDDFPGVATRLARFLGVRDASPFAEFATHARKAPFIATPSYAQVTEPVNRAAIGRWQHYRDRFDPVLPVLRPWIERFGYSA